MPQWLDAHISCRIHALHIGLLGGVGYNIPLLIQLHKAFDRFRCRGIPGKHKDTERLFAPILRHLSGGGIFIPCVSQPVFTGYFLHHRIGQHRDLLVILRLIGNGRGAGEVGFTDKDRHMPGKFRQKYAFLRRRVTAAHHKDLFVRKEFSVAGGTVSNAPALVFFLAFETNRSGMRAGCQKDAKTAIIPLAGMHRLDIPEKIKAYGFCHQKFRAEALCLMLHGIRQRFAAGFGDTGIVDHLMGNGDLSAKLFSLQNQHPILRPGQIQGGGEPRRATADNDDIIQIVH